MKIVKYTLTKDGNIPSDIFDGGYFPIPNGKISPQDYDLIGVATDNSKFEEITTKTILIDKIKAVRIEDSKITKDEYISAVWNKI